MTRTASGFGATPHGPIVASTGILLFHRDHVSIGDICLFSASGNIIGGLSESSVGLSGCFLPQVERSC
jgi:hypothetical protein